MIGEHQGFLIVRNTDLKQGIFNKKLEIIVPFEYDDIWFEKDGFYAEKDGITGSLNVEKNEFIQGTLNKDFSPIKEKDGKFGLADENGNFTVLPVYDKIELWRHGLDYIADTADEDCITVPERYLVYKDGKTGVASRNKILVPPVYDEISHCSSFQPQKPYPYFQAQLNGLYGYINHDGEPLSEFSYIEIDFPVFRKIAHCIRKDNLYDEFINLETQKVILTDSDEKIKYFSTKMNHLTVYTKDKKYKVYDENGLLLTEFDDNDKIRSTGLGYLNEKVLDYGYFFSKKESSGYGLVDYSGNVLTDAIYKEIIPIKNSDLLLCRLIFGERCQLLNSNGNTIKNDMYAASPLSLYNDGSGKLPVMYWQNELLDGPLCFYPEARFTDEELLRRNLYQKYADKKEIFIVDKVENPFVYVIDKKDISVYDVEGNLLKRTDFTVKYFPGECMSSENFDEFDDSDD